VRRMTSFIRANSAIVPLILEGQQWLDPRADPEKTAAGPTDVGYDRTTLLPLRQPNATYAEP
jgi:hypothetical protein